MTPSVRSLTLTPIWAMNVIVAIDISAAMKPYSMAVAPRSSRTKLTKRAVI
ncbi:hypothetical protein C8D03_0518 [Bosea sp. 124]|nr:hypothetical protein C8D03_0518 [Bosea sp. 124]